MHASMFVYNAEPRRPATQDQRMCAEPRPTSPRPPAQKLARYTTPPLLDALVGRAFVIEAAGPQPWAPGIALGTAI